MTTAAQEIGGLEAPVEVRQLLAAASRDYHCPECGISHTTLLLGGGEQPIDVDEAQLSVTHHRPHNAMQRRIFNQSAILLLVASLFMLFYKIMML